MKESVELKFYWDLVRNKPLRLMNEVAYCDVTGETFVPTLEDRAEFQPLLFSTYETAVINITHWYESNCTEPEWIEELNRELLPYGI